MNLRPKRPFSVLVATQPRPYHNAKREEKDHFPLLYVFLYLQKIIIFLNMILLFVYLLFVHLFTTVPPFSASPKHWMTGSVLDQLLLVLEAVPKL